jgi:protein tyrosine phosphatase
LYIEKIDSNFIACSHFFAVVFIAWPDQSCPDVAQPLIELVQHVERSRHELAMENQCSGPVVVHCRYIHNFPVLLIENK